MAVGPRTAFRWTIASALTAALCTFAACRDAAVEPVVPTGDPVLWERSVDLGEPIARVRESVLMRRRTVPTPSSSHESQMPGAELTALDAQTGVVRWQVTSDSIFGAIAGVDEYFVSKSTTRLTARIASVDAKTGVTRWEAPGCDRVPPTRVGDAVLVFKASGAEWAAPYSLTAHDALTGAVRWTRDITSLGMVCIGTQRLAVRGDTVVYLRPVPTDSTPTANRMQFIRITSAGDVTTVPITLRLNAYATQGSVRSEVQMIGSSARVLVRDSLRLSAVDLGTGNTLWSRDLGEVDTRRLGSGYARAELLRATDAGIFASVHDASLRPVRVLLSSTTGAIVRRDAVPTRFLPLLASCGETLATAREPDGNLVVVDWLTGVTRKHIAITLGAPLWVPWPDFDGFSTTGDEQFVMVNGTWKVYSCR